MSFGVHMDPFRIHMEDEGQPNGGLGAKPPEKKPLGPTGLLLALLAPLEGPYGPIGSYWFPLIPSKASLSTQGSCFYAHL